ncbi:MAG TPA: hypothetical protein DEQ47_12690 [Solibacterales bacterium]|jgi:DNA-binding NtrC family response regulator|nr:hypothetical protein [Bryobacterales bacterium]
MSSSIKEKPETILVVDDNEAVLKTVVAILERASFRVLSAVGGVEALQVAGKTEGKIDLLLSDVEMPQMSGPDLGQTLKKQRLDIRVVLMSGGPNESQRVHKCVSAYIQKPFAPKTLVASIEHVLHSPDRSEPGGQEADGGKDSEYQGRSS